MKKNQWSPEMVVYETITAVAAVFYLGLQIYYGIAFGANAIRIIQNIAIFVLVYMGLTMLVIYPERVNGLLPKVCVGKIRIYTIRMIQMIKLLFVLSLLFTSICDVLGYRLDGAYSLPVMGIILVIVIVFEGKIIRLLKDGNKP